MKKIIAIVVVLAVVFIAASFLLKQKEKVANMSKPLDYLHSVKTTRAQEKTVVKKREFLAKIEASNSAYIASKFSAKIKNIYVNESDSVTKGDLLIALDDSEMQANLASLKGKENAFESDLASAKKVLDRNKKLLKINAISQENFENTQVMYKTKYSALLGVRESIKQIEAQLMYLNIRAPFSGKIGSKMVNIGSLALAGKPLLTLNSSDQKLIFSFVDGEYPIVVGQEVFMDGRSIGSIVKRYDDAKNALLVAEVQVSQSLPFANNSYKNISVNVQSVTGCTLPIDTILHRDNKSLIMLYEETRFIAKEVEVVLQNDKEVVLKECPSQAVAQASEAKLALLPSYGKVAINEDR